MRKNTFQQTGLLAILVSLGGCASTPPNTPPVATTQKTSANPANNYAYTITNRAESRDSQRFYLIKKNSSWELIFSPTSVKDPNVERLLYWPNERVVSFDFSKDKLTTTDSLLVCKNVHRSRSEEKDYAPCNSNFKKNESAVGARIFVGILSAGTSEIDALVMDTKTYKLDTNELARVIAEQDLASKYSQLKVEKDFDALSDKKSIRAFIEQNSNRGHDELIGKAQTRLAAINKNEEILSSARTAVGDRGVYIKKFTPPQPQKYCKPFVKDREAMNYCHSVVANQVSNLAYVYGDQAYRIDVCKKVAGLVAPGIAQNFCSKNHSPSHCSGNSAQEKRICEVLNSKG